MVLGRPFLYRVLIMTQVRVFIDFGQIGQIARDVKGHESLLQLQIQEVMITP